MGTITVYLPKYLERKLDAEILKRQKKGEQVGVSKIIQEALNDRYK